MSEFGSVFRLCNLRWRRCACAFASFYFLLVVVWRTHLYLLSLFLYLFKTDWKKPGPKVRVLWMALKDIKVPAQPVHGGGVSTHFKEKEKQRKNSVSDSSMWFGKDLFKDNEGYMLKTCMQVEGRLWRQKRRKKDQAHSAFSRFG